MILKVEEPLKSATGENNIQHTELDWVFNQSRHGGFDTSGSSSTWVKLRLPNTQKNVNR